MAAGAGVDRAVDAVQRGVGDLAARAAAGIGRAGGLQFMQGFPIGGAAPALVDDFPVPVQAERFEGAQDVVRRTRYTARRVEVFHAHQPGAVMFSCVEIAANCGSEGAEVQGAGG